MLRLSSAITAMIFCCGLRAATLMAGSQSRSSSNATSADCSAQTMTALLPLIEDVRRVRLCQIAQASSPAVPMSAAMSTQRGHEPSNTNVPFENTLGGYLNRNSNIGCGAAQEAEQERKFSCSTNCRGSRIS